MIFFSYAFCRMFVNVPLTLQTQNAALVTGYKERHMQGYANENKMNIDLKTTDSDAAVREDAVFILIAYLCSDGKALEEHF